MSSSKLVTITDDELKQLNSQIVRLTSEKYELVEMNNTLMGKAADITLELDRMSGAVVNAQVAQQEASNEGKKKSRFDKLVSSVKDLKGVSELQAEVEVLKAQVLKTDCDGARLEAMELNVRHLQASNRAAQEEATTFQNTARDLEKELISSEDTIATMEDAAKQMQEKLETLKIQHTTERSSLEDKTASSTLELERLRERFAECEEVLSSRTIELDTARETCDEQRAEMQKLSKKHSEETDANDTLVADLRQKAADLRNEFEQADALRQELAARTALMETEHAEERARLLVVSNEREQQREAETNEASKTNEALQNEVSGLEKQIIELNASLSESVAGCKEAVIEKEVLQTQLDEVNTSLRSEMERVREMTEALESSVQTAQQTQEQDVLQDMQQLKVKLDAALETEAEMRRLLATKEEDSAVQEAENSKLQTQLAHVKQQLSESGKRNGQEKQQLTARNGDVGALEKQVITQKKAVRDAKAEIANLQELITKLRTDDGVNEREELMKQMEQKDEDLAMLMQRVTDLNMQSKEAADLQLELANSIQIMQQEHEQQVHASDREIERLNKSLQEKEETLTKQQTEAGEYREASQKNVALLEEISAGLKKQVGDLTASLRERVSECDDLKAAAGDIREKEEGLKEMEQTKETLHAVEEKLRRAEEEGAKVAELEGKVINMGEELVMARRAAKRVEQLEKEITTLRQSRGDKAGASNTTLQEENNELIKRVSTLQEAGWKKEGELQQAMSTVKFLREDNTKKGTIINHWIAGPAMSQLARGSGQRLLSKPSTGSSWGSMFGMGSGGSVDAMARDQAQRLLEDALSENLRLKQELETTKKT
eukprot:TRINITY_DN4627_c2_g1_i1.p1 TRINITY_DN4627_c2_g1~~TRINITY_DN4627_c2_g1_i1.p1  ORF type:complete len:846 (+),score=288.42 TRINITY_DN4627_c2_g1_i1:29-2539(+)